MRATLNNHYTSPNRRKPCYNINVVIKHDNASIRSLVESKSVHVFTLLLVAKCMKLPFIIWFARIK